MLNISAAGLPWVRTFGATGSGSDIGQPPQLSLADGGGMCLTPWSPISTSVLVADNLNGRVVEVDFVSGVLLKVWLTGLDYPLAVAASMSVIAVANHGTNDKVSLYSLSGVLLRAFGGAPLTQLDTSNLGVRMGFPWSLQFSQDAATIVVSETYSQRVTRWGVANATFVSGE